MDHARSHLLHIPQALHRRRPQQCHPRRTPTRLLHPHPFRNQLHRYPTSLPRHYRRPYPQPHARRTYPFRRQSPLLRLSSLHPPDQRTRRLQTAPTRHPNQLLSHHRQPRLVPRFSTIQPFQRMNPNHQNHPPTDHHINASQPSIITIPQPPRPQPQTNIISHLCTPKSPKPVLILSWNERSHVYAYLPTFSITTLTSRKNSKSPKRAILTDF